MVIVNQSGVQVGDAYIAKFILYIQAATALPLSANGRCLNLAELVRLTGIPRTSFYQNPSLVKLLGQASIAFEVPRSGNARRERSTVSDRVSPSNRDEGIGGADSMRNAIHKLESANSALMAENIELRKQLRLLKLELGRQDMVIDTGRRIYSLLEQV